MLPLLPQLLCAVAERLSRKAIALDPSCLPKLRQLQGKQLAFALRELKLTIVVSAGSDSLLFNQQDETADCRISTDLASLRQLRDPSQLTRLIKADALQIDGDLQLAQQYASFFQQLDLDWQTELARYLGDAPSHKLLQTLSQLNSYCSQKWQLLQQTQLELVQDELQLVPVRAEYELFTQQLSQLQGQVEQVRRKIQQLQESRCA